MRSEVRYPISVLHRTWRVIDREEGWWRVGWQTSLRNNTDSRLVVWVEARFVDDRFCELHSDEVEVIVEPYTTAFCDQTTIIAANAAAAVQDVWVNAEHQ